MVEQDPKVEKTMAPQSHVIVHRGEGFSLYPRSFVCADPYCGECANPQHPLFAKVDIVQVHQPGDPLRNPAARRR